MTCVVLCTYLLYQSQVLYLCAGKEQREGPVPTIEKEYEAILEDLTALIAGLSNKETLLTSSNRSSQNGKVKLKLD